MKLLYPLLCTLVCQLFYGCTDHDTQISIGVNSHLTNLSESNILILDTFGDTLEVTVVQTDNLFTVKHSDLDGGYFTLICSDSQFALYLQPDYVLHIEINGDKATFSGLGAGPNTYLQRKYSAEFDWYGNYFRSKQTGSITAFFRDQYIEMLKKELEKLEGNPEFVQDEFKELEYEYVSQLLMDKVMLETNPATDKDILKDLGIALNIDTENFHDLNSSPNYVASVAQILIAQDSISHGQLNNYYSRINHPIFKAYFLESLVDALRKELQFAEDDFEKAIMVESFINEQQARDSIGAPVFKLFHKFKEAEGKMVNFSYETIDGQTLSLENLRGKYVYIDIWATWCTNCIKEFPHLKKLEAQFDGDEIEFVGISIDESEAKEKWRKMVVEKELDNIQLLAPFQGYPDMDVIDDEFMKDAYVNSYYLGIPQYILIDPDGKIVDAFFYRPSNPKTARFFSNLIGNSDGDATNPASS